MGVFDAFAESGGVEMTAQELSSKTKGDDALLGRVSLSLSISFFPFDILHPSTLMTLQSVFCVSSALTGFVKKLPPRLTNLCRRR